MGRAAQCLVAEKFSLAAFSAGISRSVATAQSYWRARPTMAL
jgi:hypothetical protein